MQLNGTVIEDTYAEAFDMWAARLIVTADDPYWVDIAAGEACGYGTSIIGCDCEAGIESILTAEQTPDHRPGAALLFFARHIDALAGAIANRIGQCLMTCPTTAVHDGLSDVVQSDRSTRLAPGKWVSYFGDGFEQTETIRTQTYFRIPVMEGQFLVVETVGAVKAIGGGNLLICGSDQAHALAAARRAVDVLAPLDDIITPFPGGIVRCGSKVGSRHDASSIASTHEAYCPTLRDRVKSKLPAAVNCVYEIIIDGLSVKAVGGAMKAAIKAACGPGVVAISAGNYGGKLGRVHFKLHELLG
jgi:formylmethanofuran--tetrahydromethanopterin N-formyltransferase